MHTFLLQDWTTISLGPLATGWVVQDPSGYLDLEPFESYVAWVETRNVNVGSGSNVQIWLETAPVEEDTFFYGILNPNPTTVTLALGVQVVTNLLNAPLPNIAPLARFLRWKLVGANNASATFRILISAHCPFM